MPVSKIQPSYLKKGDEVAIISPSYFIDEKKLEDSVRILEDWGLKIHISKNALKREGPFAGTEKERISDIQEMTLSANIKAVFCSRGGYGLLKIIDRIDFSMLKRYPKWFIGFSDVTVLLIWLSEIYGIMTIHGEMPLNYLNSDINPGTLGSLHDALFGELKPVRWQGKFIRPGTAVGEMTGGNLSLLYSLIGTVAEPKTRGRILFLEDTEEYLYHIDRMITSLRLAGKLKGLSALVSGGFTRLEDTKVPWGINTEQIILSVTEDYKYPVFTGFPAGHTDDNRAFYIGRKARIIVKGEEAVFSYL